MRHRSVIIARHGSIWTRCSAAAALRNGVPTAAAPLLAPLPHPAIIAMKMTRRPWEDTHAKPAGPVRIRHDGIAGLVLGVHWTQSRRPRLHFSEDRARVSYGAVAGWAADFRNFHHLGVQQLDG